MKLFDSERQEVVGGHESSGHQHNDITTGVAVETERSKGLGSPTER